MVCRSMGEKMKVPKKREELEGQSLMEIISKRSYEGYIDWKNEQLDKEVMQIVEGAISKINMASLASGIPCDPDTSDGIRSIELCLEKMKKGEKI